MMDEIILTGADIKKMILEKKYNGTCYSTNDFFDMLLEGYTSRPGSIGVHSGGEARLSGIEKTKDLNILDKGIYNREKISDLKSKGIRPTIDYFGGNRNHLTSAMYKLTSLHPNIEFETFNNGEYIIASLNGKKERLKPNTFGLTYV